MPLISLRSWASSAGSAGWPSLADVGRAWDFRSGRRRLQGRDAWRCTRRLSSGCRLCHWWRRSRDTPVDLEAGTLRVVRTRVLVDGKAVESVPKTDAGRRTIPLDDTLVARLRSHRARQGTERLVAGSAWSDDGFVFADQLGRPLYPDLLSERFAALTTVAGLRRIRLHDLRHTTASLLIAAGVPVKVVA